MPRFRLTIRRLMILVALVAVGLAIKGGVDRRAAWFEAESERHLVNFLTYADIPARRAECQHELRLYVRCREVAERPWRLYRPEMPEP